MIKFIILLSFFSFSAAFGSAPITQCDKVAADPFDINRVKGVDGVQTYDLTDISESACKEAIKNFPDEERFYYQLARIFESKGIFDQADIFYQKAIDINPNHEPSNFFLAVSKYYYEDDYDIVINDFKNFKKKNFKYRSSEINFFLASSYYFSQRYVLLEPLLKDLLEEINNPSKNNLSDDQILKINFMDAYLENDPALEEEKYLKIIKFITDRGGLSFNQEYLLSAYDNLAGAYEDLGKGLEAVTYYELILEIIPDDIDAFYSLSRIYESGMGRLNQDYTKAYNYILKAVELGDPGSYSMLGYLYEYGSGVEQSFEKAFKYYELAYQTAREPYSYGALAYLYENGFGVDKDFLKARTIYQDLLDTYKKNENNPDFFLISNNLPEQLETARKSIIRINNILSGTSSPVSIETYSESDVCTWIEGNLEDDYSQDDALRNCMRAAIRGDAYAIEKIALFYEDGVIYEQNFDTAIYWYKKLSLLNDTSGIGDWESLRAKANFKISMLTVNGFNQEHIDIKILPILNELINFPHTVINEDNYVLESKYQMGLMYMFGIEVKKDWNLAKNIFQNILDYNGLTFDGLIDLKTLSKKNIIQIKATEAGYAVEKDVEKYFPAEFKGKFVWDNALHSEQSLDLIRLEKLKRLGPYRFEINGFVKFDHGGKLDLYGFLDTRKNNFKVEELYPKDADQSKSSDYVLNSKHYGFFYNNFSELSSYYISNNNTGYTGLLTAERIEKQGEIKTNIPEQLPLNFGNYYALVIGNENYQNERDLDTPINDVTTIAAVLEKKYGFNIIKIIENGDRRTILSNLNALKNKLQREDNLLIYYAGHGAYDEAGRGYWLPVDADSIQSEDTTQWISTDDVSNILTKIKSNHILVVADSCFSGSLTTRGGNEIFTSENKVNIFKNLIEKKVRKALTSGGLEPVLDGGGGDGNYSIFADSFIRLLSNNNSVLATNSLYTDLGKMVSSVSSQTPQYGAVQRTGDEGGDFIFVPIN
tara:strand:+ start:418 stop:3390 length:2973 start_codon:yes stop_codon:yes gene_type:complete